MCGRFAIGMITAPEWTDWLGLDLPGEWPDPSWNIAPTDRIPVLRKTQDTRTVVLARWGLIPFWWKKPIAEMKATTFNARSEEAFQKPMFRDAWRRGRCLIPAIGYYEWTGPKGAKTPWFITQKRNTPGFCMAGLWSELREGDVSHLTCTILTTAADEATRHLHPRSPVVIEEPDWETWLTAATDGHEMMRPIANDRVDVWEVDRSVGQVRNDGAELTEPAGLRI